MSKWMNRALSRRGALASVLALALFTGLAQPAFAAEREENFIRSLGSRAVDVLKDKNITPAQRQERFAAMFVENFDVPAIGMFVLGRFANRATDAQKAEYLRLFEGFIVRNYAQKLGQYSGETFAVRDSRVENNQSVVFSEIMRPSGPPVRVDWRLRDANGELKIVDVVIEGVSMSITHRSEFASVITNGGGNVDALINALRRQASRAP